MARFSPSFVSDGSSFPSFAAFSACSCASLVRSFDSFNGSASCIKRNLLWMSNASFVNEARCRKRKSFPKVKFQDIGVIIQRFFSWFYHFLKVKSRWELRDLSLKHSTVLWRREIFYVELNSEHCQTTKINFFVKIINGLSSFRKKVQLRCLTGL